MTQTQQQPQPRAQTRSENSEPMRTLIVDDEPLAIERMQVICAKLESLSVVGTANDGEAALRLADALHPDLVLLDMTMPGMDGLEVARKLSARTSARTRSVPPSSSSPHMTILRSRRSIAMPSITF